MASNNTARPLASFSDQQIIDEMLARFIVPQWYTYEDITEKCHEANDYGDLSKTQQKEVLARVWHSIQGGHFNEVTLDEYLADIILNAIEAVKEEG